MRELAGKLVAVAVGAVALILASGGVSLAAQVAQSGTGVLVPSSPGATLPLQGGSTDSLNWSGYAVTPGSGITAVSSTFTVPKAGILPPGWARPAAWGDLGAAFLAIAATLAFAANAPWAIALVWVFNIWGTVDLLNAMVQGPRKLSKSGPGALGTTFYIPTLIVPGLLALHAMIFRLLVS